MPFAVPEKPNSPARVLHAYLLGRIHLADALLLQRRLIYEVGGERSTGYLVLCEHPATVTIGRAGSLGHVQLEPAELRARQWEVCRVNRGSGCLLHTPGQLVGYAVVALDALGFNLQQYLDRLHTLLVDVLQGLEVPAKHYRDRSGVWVNDRQVAHVGVSVRDWISSFGFAINIHPDLEPFRKIRCNGEAAPMTSLTRERRSPVRPASVRQRLLEAFAEAFAFERVSLFHSHPLLNVKASSHAVASGSR